MSTPQSAPSQPTKEMTIDELRAKVRVSRPVCKECGHSAHSLISHLREAHGLSVGQYRKKYPDAEIASPMAMELLRHLGKEPVKTVSNKLANLVPSLDIKAALTTSAEVDKWKQKLTWYSPPPEAMIYVPEVNPRFEFTKNSALIAMAFAVQRNLFISGPTGCGKTEEIKQVFNRLGFPLRRANMHGDVTYGTFVGAMKANASGTYFDYGLLPLAMKGGYPVLLDEVDFTPPNIASILFPVLEQDAELYIPETGEHIRPAKGFCIYATGNTGGKGDGVGSFTGTEVLNTAFLDRFSFKLTADYLPVEKEVQLLMASHPALPELFCRRTVALATEIRNAFLGGDLAFTWSTRKVLDFVSYAQVLGTSDALDVTLRNWLDKDDRPLVDTLYRKVGLEQIKI